eukprot:274153_1
MLMGKTDYFDKYYTGKIYKFIENNYKLGDKGFIGCDIDKQLINGDPNTSTFATFDIKSFPMHDSWSIDEGDFTKKKYAIFLVIQHCCKFYRPPSVEYIEIKLSGKKLNIENVHSDNNLLMRPELISLEIILRKYNLFMDDPTNVEFSMDDIDQIDMQTVINDYLDLQCYLEHESKNKDEDVRLVYLVLGYCDYRKCKIFHRHQRDNKSLEYNDSVKQKIYCLQHVNCEYEEMQKILFCFQQLDVIHVYFSHRNDKRHEKHLLSTKTNQCHSTTSYTTPHQRVRFNQLQEDVEKNVNTDENTYHYGFSFRYGYKGESQWNSRNVVEVSPKYLSLKEELLTNQYITLHSKQFQQELTKAMMHLNSHYCKKFYMHAHSSDEYYNKEWVLSIDYLLALMIYCNFDRIGYEFSKSYREDDGKQHTEWFWM